MLLVPHSAPPPGDELRALVHVPPELVDGVQVRAATQAHCAVTHGSEAQGKVELPVG